MDNGKVNGRTKKLLAKGGIFLILLFFPLFPASILARPLSTDDVGITEKGTFALETGFDAIRLGHHDRIYNPSLTLTYGLFERIEVGAGGEYLFFQPKEGEKESGFADTELTLKYRLTNETPWIPSFGVKGALKVPTASESKGLGSGKTDFNTKAIATKNLSNRLAVSLNLGYTFIGEHRVSNDLTYSLGVIFAMSDRWAVVGEVTGSNKLNGRREDRPFSGLIGTYYRLADNITWDIGLEIRTNKAAPDYRMTTGFTFLFKPPF
jgi:outer membrane putative beta-barrel porin/alpha-amylase